MMINLLATTSSWEPATNSYDIITSNEDSKVQLLRIQNSKGIQLRTAKRLVRNTTLYSDNMHSYRKETIKGQHVSTPQLL